MQSDLRSAFFYKLERSQIWAQLIIGLGLFALPELKEEVLSDSELLLVLVLVCTFLVVGNLYDEHMELTWKAALKPIQTLILALTFDRSPRPALCPTGLSSKY